MTANRSRNRLDFIDLARSVAILLAMTSHIFIHTDVWVDCMSKSTYLVLRSITRTATPSFIILFGVMIELVYYKKIRDGGAFSSVSKRLVSRAFVCYFGVVFLESVALTAGKIDTDVFVEAITFSSPGGFAVILKFYSFAMLIAPLLICIRHRGGIYALVVPVALAWLLSPLIHEAFRGSADVHHLYSYLFGIGNKIGPTVDKGLTFIVYGMVLGRVIARYFDNSLQAKHLFLPAMMLLLAVGIVVHSIVEIGAFGFFSGITGHKLPAELHFRKANMAEYYAYGIVTTSAILVLCILATSRLTRISHPMILAYGANSLFAYTFGNAVINALPYLPESVGGPGRYAVGFLFLLFLLLASDFQLRQKQRLQHSLPVNPLYKPVVPILDAVQALSDRIGELLVGGAQNILSVFNMRKPRLRD
jgi:uncharacterized membrane protein